MKKILQNNNKGTITNDENGKFENKGTITVDENTTFENKGTLEGDGEITYDGDSKLTVIVTYDVWEERFVTKRRKNL